MRAVSSQVLVQWSQSPVCKQTSSHRRQVQVKSIQVRSVRTSVKTSMSSYSRHEEVESVRASLKSSLMTLKTSPSHFSSHSRKLQVRSVSLSEQVHVRVLASIESELGVNSSRICQIKSQVIQVESKLIRQPPVKSQDFDSSNLGQTLSQVSSHWRQVQVIPRVFQVSFKLHLSDQVSSDSIEVQVNSHKMKRLWSCADLITGCDVRVSVLVNEDLGDVCRRSSGVHAVRCSASVNRIDVSKRSWRLSSSL